MARTLKREHDKHLGAKSELMAVVWLLKRGYEVFRNVSAHGCIDIVAIKDEEIIYLDVRTANMKYESRASVEQSKHKVKFIYVDRETGDCVIKDPLPARDLSETALCAGCGKEIQVWGKNAKRLYCGRPCKNKTLRDQIRRERGMWGHDYISKAKMIALSEGPEK